MKVYLIAGLLLVLVGCGLSMDATQGESRFILEEPIKDSSFEKSRPILSDLFVHAMSMSEDAKLDKRSIHKDTFNHSQCANLKAHGFCKYSIIKDTYCHTTCRCNDILSKDSCKKIKERNECDRFREHCKLTCLKCGQCNYALGMENRAIPNARITASSTAPPNFSPAYARLNGRIGYGCWAARRNRAGEWIQVDLGKVTMVTGCATQGRYTSDQWLTSYSLQYSLDGRTFKAYEGGKVFSANRDRNTVVKHELKTAIIARYIRLVAKTWHGHISMRMELYGCSKQ